MASFLSPPFFHGSIFAIIFIMNSTENVQLHFPQQQQHSPRRKICVNWSGAVKGVNHAWSLKYFLAGVSKVQKIRGLKLQIISASRAIRHTPHVADRIKIAILGYQMSKLSLYKKCFFSSKLLLLVLPPVILPN